MKIDFCVVINENSNSYLLTKLFFETFFRYTNVSDLSIHVVVKVPNISEPDNIKRSFYGSVDEQTLNYLNIKKESSPCPFSIYQLNSFLSNIGPDDKAFFNVADDTATTAEWVVENCGTAKWVVIAHSDLDFNADAVQFLSTQMSETTGQIGEHNLGIVAYNRIAYKQSFVGFTLIGSFHSVPIDDGTGEHKILYGSDPRRNGRGPRIRGWDVGELYTLEVQSHGWGFVPLNDGILLTAATLGQYVSHIRGGSGHNNNIDIQEHIRQEVMNRLRNKGISI